LICLPVGIAPPWSVIVWLIGTFVVPIANSPLVVCPNWHSFTPGTPVGQSENTENMPFGVASAGEATASTAIAAIEAASISFLIIKTTFFRCLV
jgi:hypothetical protein